MPKTPVSALGISTDPLVSVPSPRGAKLAASAAPVPQLDPPVVKSRLWGFRVWPPRVLALMGALPNQSLALTFARMMAPASLSFRVTVASRGGKDSAKPTKPPVVGNPAASIVSLRTTGTPCSGPRGPDSSRSLSSRLAVSRQSSLRVMTALTSGPRLS